MKHSLSLRLVVVLPYLWLLVFFLAPFLLALKISFSQTAMALPPYQPVLDFGAGWPALREFFAQLSADSYALIASDPLYLSSFLKSLQVAGVSTVLLLLIGYPLAYGIARSSRNLQPLLVMLVVLPFWTSFLIRVYAWINILQRDGLLNHVLLALHVIDVPRGWLATDTAIYIGVVYSYLPFMVLPLYAALQKIDPALLEAATDLGCPRWLVFWRVILPLTRAGIAAGALLCFIPIMGEFVIPDLLGSSQSLMVGQTLWTEFFSNRDWPVASAIAVTLLIALLGPILIYERLQRRAIEGES